MKSGVPKFYLACTKFYLACTKFYQGLRIWFHQCAASGWDLKEGDGIASVHAWRGFEIGGRTHLGLLLRPCTEVWCGFWFVDSFSHLARTARFYSFGNRKLKFLHKRRKIPMTYDTCVVFSQWVHIAIGFWKNMFEAIRIVQNCPKLIHL